MSYINIKEVANLFGVSEKTVYRLRNKGTIPAVKIGGQWRFDRQEIESHLKGEISDNKRFSSKKTTNTESDLLLSEALLSGGIFFNISGKSLEEVLENAINNIYITPKDEQDKLIKAIIFREGLCTTAIGNGIALPHPRHPSSFNFKRSSISLCFLEDALNLGAMDEKPVNKLFFIFGKTDQEHLQLLKLLANMLHQPDFLSILTHTANRLDIVKIIRQLEHELSNIPEKAPAGRWS